MDDLSKVIGRLVAFLRFCCSLNGKTTVTQRHAHFFHQLPVGGRHASRNVAKTIRCDFFIAKNLDCVQWHCPYQKQCNGNESNVVCYILTSFHRRVSAEDVGKRWSHDKR